MRVRVRVRVRVCECARARARVCVCVCVCLLVSAKHTDIDGLAGQEQEIVKLVNYLEEASTAYGMQISAEKTQLMTNNTNGISTDITIDNKKLDTVRIFKYLGAIVSDERTKPEVLSRIVQNTAAVTKLKVIWNDKNIAISSKIRLMRSLAMSIFLYACET